MTKRAATSYSATLDLSSLSSRTHWSILSSHRHACNLLAADGTLVALVDEAHGNGPFHIVAPGAHFNDIADDAVVRWQESQLHLGHLVIDLRGAIPWNPRLPLLTNPSSLEQLNRYAKLVTMRSALYCGSTALTERAQHGIQCLRQGLAQHRDSTLREGTNLLAGLGPGLTPAGDDFLVGFMAALWASDTVSTRSRQLCMGITGVAIPRTTHLSGAWLAYAGDGYFGEQWHRLLEALNIGQQREVEFIVQSIRNTGATSGADALYGFLSALSMDDSPTGSPA